MVEGEQWRRRSGIREEKKREEEETRRTYLVQVAGVGVVFVVRDSPAVIRNEKRGMAQMTKKVIQRARFGEGP
jgi:hypothetical protein